MKLKQISLAVVAVCAAVPSFALTPAQIDGSTVQLWISGATAPTAAVYKAIRTMCQDIDGVTGPDDLHVYLEKTPTTSTPAADSIPGKSAAGKFAAYACTMGAAAGSLDGVKTVVYHTFDVGSFEAYTPHLSLAGESNALVTNSVKRLKDITSALSTCAPMAGTPDPTYTGCGAASVTVAANVSPFSLPTVPQGGFSDTEYTLNQLNLGISKSLTDIGSEVPTNVGQGFGLAVSYALYATLQKSQGIISTTAADGEACDGNYTSVACQPTINRQKYASLVSAGGVTNKDASLFGGPAGTAIEVMRRVGTSGTQSSSNAYFLNKPCGTGLLGGELSVAGNNTAGTVSYNGGKAVITSKAGSGDVKTGLTAASTAGTLAIGVLSLENVPSSTEKFAFVKLNGVSPNGDVKQRQTAIDGDYDFWYELVGFTSANAFTEGADLINGAVVALGDPSITDLTGLFVTKAAGVTGTNVSKGYKLGNSCSPALQ